MDLNDTLDVIRTLGKVWTLRGKLESLERRYNRLKGTKYEPPCDYPRDTSHLKDPSRAQFTSELRMISRRESFDNVVESFNRMLRKIVELTKRQVIEIEDDKVKIEIERHGRRDGPARHVRIRGKTEFRISEEIIEFIEVPEPPKLVTEVFS